MSRRRRRAAMFAIAGGLAVLRPLLWRSVFLALAVTVVLLVRV